MPLNVDPYKNAGQDALYASRDFVIRQLDTVQTVAKKILVGLSEIPEVLRQEETRSEKVSALKGHVSIIIKDIKTELIEKKDSEMTKGEEVIDRIKDVRENVEGDLGAIGKEVREKRDQVKEAVVQKKWDHQLKQEGIDGRIDSLKELSEEDKQGLKEALRTHADEGDNSPWSPLFFEVKQMVAGIETGQKQPIDLRLFIHRDLPTREANTVKDSLGPEGTEPLLRVLDEIKDLRPREKEAFKRILERKQFNGPQAQQFERAADVLIEIGRSGSTEERLLDLRKIIYQDPRQLVLKGEDKGLSPLEKQFLKEELKKMVFGSPEHERLQGLLFNRNNPFEVPDGYEIDTKITSVASGLSHIDIKTTQFVAVKPLVDPVGLYSFIRQRQAEKVLVEIGLSHQVQLYLSNGSLFSLSAIIEIGKEEDPVIRQADLQTLLLKEFDVHPDFPGSVKEAFILGDLSRTEKLFWGQAFLNMDPGKREEVERNFSEKSIADVVKEIREQERQFESDLVNTLNASELELSSEQVFVLANVIINPLDDLKLFRDLVGVLTRPWIKANQPTDEDKKDLQALFERLKS